MGWTATSCATAGKRYICDLPVQTQCSRSPMQIKSMYVLMPVPSCLELRRPPIGPHVRGCRWWSVKGSCEDFGQVCIRAQAVYGESWGPLSEVVCKPFSYTGPEGCFSQPVFQPIVLDEDATEVRLLFWGVLCWISRGPVVPGDAGQGVPGESR